MKIFASDHSNIQKFADELYGKMNGYLEKQRPKVKLITDPEGNKVDGEVVDLAERDPETNTFTRSIIKNLDNNTYKVRIPDYFVAAAQESV